MIDRLHRLLGLAVVTPYVVACVLFAGVGVWLLSRPDSHAITVAWFKWWGFWT